jgi:predicted AAA+ superfamily ATPase
MYFKRKTYQQLLEWKLHSADRYAVLLEGAKRVGKSTIAEHFAKSEYRSYILIDFSNVSANILRCFEDISNIDLFFLRLQAETGITLYEHESLVIFDEVQLYPMARQAIKHLVADGRYHYLETGSLISIRKNVKDILIPSEEMKIQVYPMDYEEFCEAVGWPYDIYRDLYNLHTQVGQATNQTLMRRLRIYMAVGGMPQAVEAFVNKANFSQIDQVKRQIIALYEEDFRKLDSSGRVSALYHDIPAQLAKKARRYSIAGALGKRRTSKDDRLLQELMDSKTVLPCWNTTDPRVSLSGTKNVENYKLYLSDTGLFVTLMFMDRPVTENQLYTHLASDKLPANLGYLYENLAAQMIAASGREIFFHSWDERKPLHEGGDQKEKTHYEVDFLLSAGQKINALEVKSSGTGKHLSLLAFKKRYSQHVKDCYIISKRDIGVREGLKYLPVYLLPFLLEFDS